ncbi:hypothetical protein OBBRIDRAFT_885985 [Obba rivulosa]|uniref:Amidoligase enzyme n=1 Tax=Obba rivulosa TaxID=1052685 RepID=A0A8E2B2K4_9APHY|nr:hypothetical protein OBBRIDRAFT_885985 [Obba rivulosa]
MGRDKGPKSALPERIPLTLGIEIETVVDGVSPQILQLIQEALAAQNFVAYATMDADFKQDITKWVIKPDGSINEKLGPAGIDRAGVEIVSPILHDPPAFRDELGDLIDWHNDVKRAFQALIEKGIRSRANPTTGLHIHVGLLVNLPKDRPWPLAVLKKIATIIYLYEWMIDQFHPAYRSGGDNTSGNLHTAGIRDNRSFKKTNEKANNVEEDVAVSLIWGAQTQQELQKVMNPSNDKTVKAEEGRARRYYKVNFMALNIHGTLEFRQHAGTDNHDVVCAWADFVLAIVRYAWLESETNVKNLLRTRIPLREIVGDSVYGRMQRTHPNAGNA